MFSAYNEASLWNILQTSQIIILTIAINKCSILDLLISAGQGYSTDLTIDTLTENTRNWRADDLIGIYLNPKTDQSSYPPIVFSIRYNDSINIIVDNTSSNITDIADIAIGDQYIESHGVKSALDSCMCDRPSAITVDTSGNVYVTGESYGSGASYDYATIKYDTNGNQLWSATYNGTGNWYDRANAMIIDTNGNIYVTGESYNGADYDYATIKYDTSGNQLWTALYDGAGSWADYAIAITIDASGNIYITGQSDNGADYDYTTIKYDTRQPTTRNKI